MVRLTCDSGTIHSMNNRPNKAMDTVQTRKAQFSIGLPGRQFVKLTKLAQREGVSRSSYAAAVLENHLAALERKA
jgi:hypothetical protein